MRSQGPTRETPTQEGATDSRLRITSAEEAEKLVSTALATLDKLEPLIEQETHLFRIGKVREALALAMEKNEAAQVYTRCLEVLKANAIAIGRFRPSGLEQLKGRHQRFSQLMSLNIAVVHTARTVSEGLLRELADTLGKNATPKTYAPLRGVTRKAGTAPLALSKVS